MKKSELKALLRVITEEVIAAKKSQLNETKGLSGFKKSKDSTEHTEKIAASKDLTGKGPAEKSEGKKLPVVKKPATPQKVGSIKEEILEMIREAIADSGLDEMSRVAGAVGSKFKVQDASSPTGWVVKGHKTIPDGTPTEAPKGPYVPKGIAGMGRPKKAEPVAIGGGNSDDATRGAIENILTAAPETTDDDIIQQLSTSASEEEVSLNLDPTFVKKVASELRKELSADKDTQPEDAPESDLAAMASSEEKRKAAQRAAWIKKLQATRRK